MYSFIFYYTWMWKQIFFSIHFEDSNIYTFKNVYQNDKIVMNFYLDKCIWEYFVKKIKYKLKKKTKFYTELLKWCKELNEWFTNRNIYIYIHCCLIVKELSEEQGHVRKC